MDIMRQLTCSFVVNLTTVLQVSLHQNDVTFAPGKPDVESSVDGHAAHACNVYACSYVLGILAVSAVVQVFCSTSSQDPRPTGKGIHLPPAGLV